MRLTHIVPTFVTLFPEELEAGQLYVSDRFSIASHLCACGCGREVVTPLSPSQWVLTFDGSVSMMPSIGNWLLPCQSHYVIDRGAIRWARSLTTDEIRLNRESDHRILDEARPHEQLSWWRRLCARLRRR